MALRAFIVRPFGTKNDKQGRPIDFDRVERELIAPALTALDIEGRTTGEIAAAGNIREDMFRMLIASDVAIADISIHNANDICLRNRHLTPLAPFSRLRKKCVGSRLIPLYLAAEAYPHQHMVALQSPEMLFPQPVRRS